MERSRRLYDLWSWLVPFRAVAEAESVSEASKTLHVASSALSRSVKLLEETLGRPLFDRRPGSVTLNDRGHQLLAAVRTAMRILDDGVAAVDSDTLVGAIHVAVPGELLPIVIGPLRSLTDRHPGLLPSITELTDNQALAALRRGHIDVAIVKDDIGDDQLRFRALAPVERSICVGPNHPAASAGAAELDSLEFVVTVDDERNPRDGFPNHVPRNVALKIASGTAVVEVARQGELAVVLPQATAAAAGLTPLRIDVQLAPMGVSVALRPCVYQPGPADEAADLLCERFGKATVAKT